MGRGRSGMLRSGCWGVLWLTLAGCGGGGSAGPDTSCPPGYVWLAGRCLPAVQPEVSDDGTGSDGSGAPDLPDAGAVPDGAPADLADADDTGTRPDPGSPPDADVADAGHGPDNGQPTGVVGDPCRLDRECQAGLSCLGWNRGYCTLLDCDPDAQPCPAGSVCLPLVSNANACFRSCEDDPQVCRGSDGYACKWFDGAGGAGPVAICHGTDDDALPAGSPCVEHSQCAGPMACLSSIPGGYCAELHCSIERPCADNAACVLFDGRATCLARCAADAECNPAGGDALACQPQRGLDGATVSVCLTRRLQLGIGEACLSDYDCQSGQCEVYGTGRCSTTQQPCFTREDCDAEACEPASTIGACTAPCSSGVACTLGGKCVSNDGVSGHCMPNCAWDAVHLSHDCRSDTAWDCVYGVPLAGTGAGSYACHLLAQGDAGATCQADSECATGLTCQLPGTRDPEGRLYPGYCTRTCSLSAACPFGSYCLQYEGAGMPRCVKVCLSERDCGAGFICDRRTWSSGLSVCLPAE